MNVTTIRQTLCDEHNEKIPKGTDIWGVTRVGAYYVGMRRASNQVPTITRVMCKDCRVTDNGVVKTAPTAPPQDKNKEARKMAESALEQCSYAMKEAAILLEEQFVQDRAPLRRKADKAAQLLAELFQEIGEVRFREQ